jgi:VanZ family protein
MKISKKIFWTLVIFWSIFIAYYSLVPAEKVPGVETFGTNLLHLLSYFALSWFYFNAFGKNSKKSAYYCIISATAYGILLEILQIFTGYRNFSIIDISINFVGAALAPIMVKGIKYGTEKLAHK